jgi:hypothetical protein
VRRTRGFYGSFTFAPEWFGRVEAWDTSKYITYSFIAENKFRTIISKLRISRIARKRQYWTKFTPTNPEPATTCSKVYPLQFRRRSTLYKTAFYQFHLSPCKGIRPTQLSFVPADCVLQGRSPVRGATWRMDWASHLRRCFNPRSRLPHGERQYGVKTLEQQGFLRPFSRNPILPRPIPAIYLPEMAKKARHSKGCESPGKIMFAWGSHFIPPYRSACDKLHT